MNESDLVELPRAQASKASFPPGCRVWIHSIELAPKSGGDGTGDATPADCEVCEGTIRSIFLGDVFSVSRKIYYKVEVAKGGCDKMVEEGKMSFATNTPVSFFDNSNADGLSPEPHEAEILTAVCYGKGDSGKVQMDYSLMVFSGDSTITIKHGVKPGQLRFRSVEARECLVEDTVFDQRSQTLEKSLPSSVGSKDAELAEISSKGSLVGSGQCASLVNSKVKPSAPPGFQRLASTGSSGDGSFVVVAPKNKNGSAKQKAFQVPSWLVATDSYYNQVIETLQHALPNIFEETGCNVIIEERYLNSRNHLWLTLKVADEQGNKFRKAIELVENCLVGLLGAEEARGRLLYDMASSYGDCRPDGVVFQRNPFNSCERVWMYVVELPSQVYQGELTYRIGPLMDGKTYDSIHQANCTLKFCRDNFGVKLLRCRPYALIIGKQARNVSEAVLVIRNALKVFKQTRMVQSMLVQPLPNNAGMPGRWAALPDSSKATKKVAPKPRIMTIPGWLMAEVSLQKRLEEGLFKNEWCQHMEVGEKTGCSIILSQDDLIVTPMHGQTTPSVVKATDIIEDALVGLIGAQESKGKLLYDLTESYSEAWLGGVIQMRNPLNSCERVWATIMDLPTYVDKEGNQKYLLPPFISKAMEIHMHGLKCEVKICTENFGVELSHCDPYATIMGRSKTNVCTAVELIMKAIKTLQADTEFDLSLISSWRH